MRDLTEGEQKLINELEKVSRRIQYGDVSVKFTLSRGQIKKMEIVEETTSVLLD
jgi:hypothetical protein